MESPGRLWHLTRNARRRTDLPPCPHQHHRRGDRIRLWDTLGNPYYNTQYVPNAIAYNSVRLAHPNNLHTPQLPPARSVLCRNVRWCRALYSITKRHLMAAPT